MTQYKSMFSPDLEITLAQYITEIIIKNFCGWQKIPLPQSKFWQQQYQTNQTLKDLGKRYGVEISAVHDLLKVFSGPVLAKYFTEKNIACFKLSKAATQQKIISELFKKQVEFIKSLDTIKDRISEFETIQNKTEYVAKHYNRPSDSLIGL